MRTKLIHFVIIILCAGYLISCASTGSFSPGKGNKYRYTYKLVHPIENSDLLFQDDSVIIQFKFDEAAIRFQLQNISDSYLAIDWDRAAISIFGRYFALRNMKNLYSDSAGSNSILLPPLGYVRDIAIPRNNIYNNGEKWVEADLLPTVDHNSKELQESIMKSAGQRVGFSLPVMFGSAVKNYEFDFQIDSVNKILWKDYEPFQRIPAPPNPKRTLLGLDNVTTAVIAVGVLGFSAYVLSVKKNPPSE
jgi:hypothetical protein